MSFETRRFINDVEVRVGAEITELYSTQPVLGRRIKVGGVCEAVEPERWRSVISADGRRVWEAATFAASFDEAQRLARAHVEARLDSAIRDLFA